MKVKIKLIDGGKLPEYKHSGDACMDCFARLTSCLVVNPGETVKIPLGFCLELKKKYKATIKPRSGLSLAGKQEIMGTIDSNYRGEVSAILYNHSDLPIDILNGNRICQIDIDKVIPIKWKQINKLKNTDRGSKGFGSSGI